MRRAKKKARKPLILLGLRAIEFWVMLTKRIPMRMEQTESKPMTILMRRLKSLFQSQKMHSYSSISYQIFRNYKRGHGASTGVRIRVCFLALVTATLRFKRAWSTLSGFETIRL